MSTFIYYTVIIREEIYISITNEIVNPTIVPGMITAW